MNGGDGGAGAIRRQEQERQNRINQGLVQLNAVFSGGKYGSDLAKNFDPAGTYYTNAGDQYKFDPTNIDYLTWLKGAKKAQQPYLPHPGQGPQIPAPAPNYQDEYLKHLVQKGQLYNSSVSAPGFGPDFYAQKQNDYVAATMPQLLQQYQQTRKQTISGLANRGLLNSSVSQTAGNSLQRELGRQEQNVAGQGLGLAQGLQQQVAQERSTLTSQLEASADPGAVAVQAREAAKQFGAPSPIAPIGNLFANWSNLYMANSMGNSLNSLYASPAFRYASPSNPATGTQNIVR